MGRYVVSTAAAVAAMLGLPWPAASQPVQPEVVCDLCPVAVSRIEGTTFRSLEDTETLRLTVRDIDPKAGTARMLFGKGESGEEFAAVTVDANEITYLVERAGVFKLLVTTGNKPTAQGWPAMLSQHSTSGGDLTIRTATGSCRMRAR